MRKVLGGVAIAWVATVMTGCAILLPQPASPPPVTTGPVVQSPTHTPPTRVAPKAQRIPLRVTSGAQITSALASEGFTCDWADLTQGTLTCDDPKVMIFVDPAPELGGGLMQSTKDLYEAIFVGKGGMVFSGDNYVVGAKGEAQTAMMKITGWYD